MYQFLERPEVMKALGVTDDEEHGPLVFDGPIHGAAFRYHIEPLDLRPTYESLASRPGTTLLIYNGLSDANVPFNGLIDSLGKEGDIADDWVPWYASGEVATPPRKHEPVAGHVRAYRTPEGSGPFRFVTVNGAGHEVPSYRPRAALSMLRQFLLS